MASVIFFATKHCGVGEEEVKWRRMQSGNGEDRRLMKTILRE